MAIPRTLSNYLEAHRVRYDTVAHAHTESSLDTASAAHVPGHQLAKAVLLEDESGYLLGVVPATHKLNLSWINQELGRNLKLADEQELDGLFEDCESGAVPALGAAYGLPVIWDDQLASADDIYIEAGDHEHLVHMNGEEFQNLMARLPHSTISTHKDHSRWT